MFEFNLHLIFKVDFFNFLESPRSPNFMVYSFLYTINLYLYCNSCGLLDGSIALWDIRDHVTTYLDNQDGS